jgi:hypothetical protein
VGHGGAAGCGPHFGAHARLHVRYQFSKAEPGCGSVSRRQWGPFCASNCSTGMFITLPLSHPFLYSSSYPLPALAIALIALFLHYSPTITPFSTMHSHKLLCTHYLVPMLLYELPCTPMRSHALPSASIRFHPLPSASIQFPSSSSPFMYCAMNAPFQQL